MLDLINEKQTIANVTAFLKEYATIKRLSGIIGTVTANYSFIPSSVPSSSDGSMFRILERREKAQNQIKAIHEALELLSEEGKELLRLKFTIEPKMTDESIAYRLGFSSASYYRLLKKYKIQFAEAYKGGELLAFKE